MSVIKALQEYIQQYPEIEILNLDRVNEDANSYALYPAGNGKIKTDVCGNKTYQRSYIFLAKKAASEEFERQGNYNFLEGFCDWIEERTDKRDYPYLGENTNVESLEVSNIMLMDISEAWSTAVYQIQIKLTYEKGEW